MRYYCYIIYSPGLDKYYIGETENLEDRLKHHNDGHFENSYTSKSCDWILFHKIACKNRSQARLIEQHIKSMRSRKYIQNLSVYPEISERLLIKYKK